MISIVALPLALVAGAPCDPGALEVDAVVGLLVVRALHGGEGLGVLEEEQEGVGQHGVARRPVLPLPLPVLHQLGAVQGTLLDYCH